jgi:hypothetical protein
MEKKGYSQKYAPAGGFKSIWNNVLHLKVELHIFLWHSCFA